MSLSDLSCFLLPNLAVPVNSHYRPDIDGLRAIAVTAVMIFHVFPMWLTGGFIGVDMFFVICGYLITSIIHRELETNSFSFLKFYCRRVRRIFPSLIAVLIACYIAGWYLLLPPEYKRLGIHIAAASCFSSNVLLYNESGYFDAASDTKPLLHLWSLAIEEQFYIIWPVILYVAWKQQLNYLTLTIGLTTASFILNIVEMKTNRARTFYWPTTRAWELLTGACVASALKYTNCFCENFKTRLDGFLIKILYRKWFKPDGATVLNLLSISAVLLIKLPMYLLTKVSPFPGWWAIAPTLGTAIFILVGSTPWINRNILSSSLLIRIGIISYPLYLWHWPLLVFARFFIGHQMTYYTRIWIITLSVFLAWLTHIYIEKSFRFGGFPKMKFCFLCTLMLTVGFIGYKTYQTSGLPQRYPFTVQELMNYEKYGKDIWKSYRQGVCFLHESQTEFKNNTCIDNMEKPPWTGAILWGDSHGAHLYPGISAIKPAARVTQLTVSACPPIIDINVSLPTNCKKINDYVWKRILYEKPKTVILSARWSVYDWPKLKKTITNLKNATVENIYLVGPNPEWQNILPQCLYGYFLNDTLHRVPNRLRTCLNLNIKYLDISMEAFAKESKVNYISTYNILCNSDGCLTRAGSNVTTITFFDIDHMTVAGSVYVVSRFPTILLNSLSRP